MGYSADCRIAFYRTDNGETNPEPERTMHIRYGLNRGVKRTATGRKEYFLPNPAPLKERGLQR